MGVDVTAAVNGCFKIVVATLVTVDGPMFLLLANLLLMLLLLMFLV